MKLPRHIIIARALGFTLGFHIYLYKTKIYEDEQRLRDRGMPIDSEKPDILMYIR